MSQYFSSLDLYNSVVNSDLESLQKGIFFLGIKIHSIKIHRSVPALLYAAKLCNLDIVEFLLDDFLKYSRPLKAKTATCVMIDWKLRKDILAKLIAELGEHWSYHHHHDQIEKLVIRIRDVLFSNSGEESAIKELIRMEAFHLLSVEVITEGARFRVQQRIRWLIKYCLKFHKRQLFSLPLEIQNDSAFVDYLAESSRRLGQNVVIIRGDIEEIRQSMVVAQRFNFNESFMREVAEMNDVNIFHSLTDDVTINIFRDMYPTHDFMNMQNMLPKLLREATKVQSCELAQAVLSHQLYPLSEEDWMTFYYELISKGLVRSAACLKHLVDFSDQEKKDRIFSTVFEEKELDLLSNNDITTKDVLEVVEEVEALCTDPAEPNSPWRRKLAQFPLKMLRPELVKPLRIYGVCYTESGVLDAIQLHDKSSKPEIELLLTPTGHSNVIELKFKSSSMCTVFLGECSTDSVIMLNPPTRCFQRQYFVDLLEVCVVETGKRVGLMDITTPGRQSMIDTIESKRRASLTLKKLCRLAIRKAVILACKYTNSAQDIVQELIISLYVDGYLPKRMVEYILYRDGDKALYHYLLWHRIKL